MVISDCWDNHVAMPSRHRELVYGTRVVTCFEERPRHVFSLIEEAAVANPDGTALVMGDRRMCYRELMAAVRDAAFGLQQQGVGPGVRVAVLMANSIDYVVLMFAVMRLDGIVVPLNIRESRHEVTYILKDCGASVLLYHDHLADRVPAMADVPGLRTMIALDDTATALSVFGTSAIDPEAFSAGEQDTAVILYTSGTTGHPKGAMLTHLNIVHSVLHYRHAMGISSADRSILAVPMSHVTGLVALVATILGSGATLVIMAEFKADRFIDLAERERMTHSLLVPAMFNLCLLNPAFDGADLSNWRVSGYGGAIMPETTLKKITELLPDLELINCYGATETTSPAVMMPPAYAADRLGQVGLPVPCADIFIADENGCEVAPDTAGEIWISGPMVVPGYWNNPDATDREFAGGYWRSGDVGSIDEKGFLRVIDRIKDVINRGGYKVYASEVENVLLAYPGVTEVAAVAHPCPVLGERVHAYIVMDAAVSQESLPEDRLKEHCRTQLAEFKVPEVIHFIEALPRNANGKVLKRMLRSDAA